MFFFIVKAVSAYYRSYAWAWQLLSVAVNLIMKTENSCRQQPSAVLPLILQPVGGWECVLYHKCSWKTWTHTHTHTHTHAPLEKTSSQLWVINVSLVRHSLGDKRTTRHCCPFLVCQTKVTMETLAPSAAHLHQHWLKTCSQFLSFAVTGGLSTAL